MFLRPAWCLDATWVDERRASWKTTSAATERARAAVFRRARAAGSRPVLVEALCARCAALGATPRPEQGLLIAGILRAPRRPSRERRPRSGSDAPHRPPPPRHAAGRRATWRGEPDADRDRACDESQPVASHDRALYPARAARRATSAGSSRHAELYATGIRLDRTVRACARRSSPTSSTTTIPSASAAGSPN